MLTLGIIRMEMLVKQSNMYAIKKSNVQLEPTVPEVKVFIAILLLSGYSSLPRQQMYLLGDGR